MTHTTAVRIESILESNLRLVPLMVGVDNDSADIGGMTEAAQTIADEIERLERERDEARAEVERLRPAAEAWEASESYRRACIAWDAGRLFAVDFADERVKYNAAAARAAKERKP